MNQDQVSQDHPSRTLGSAWTGAGCRAYLLLTTWKGDPWHVAGGEQQVENCRQERPVAQQLEALAMVGGLAQQVLKG